MSSYVNFSHKRGLNRRHVFAVIAIVISGICSGPMFIFPPGIYRLQEAENGKLPPTTIQKISKNDTDYYLKIYGDIRKDNPIIFIIPPETGSAASVDFICNALEEKSLTVVTYFRSGFDSILTDENGYKQINTGKVLRYLYINNMAAIYACANEKGKTLEAERRADIEFLLPHIYRLKNTDLNSILLVGYGAGGSALAYLAGENTFIKNNSGVLGVVAIESRLWSSYQIKQKPSEKAPIVITGGSTWFNPPKIITNYLAKVSVFPKNIKPERVERTGPLPGAGVKINIPQTQNLPVLYLVSGAALKEIQPENRRRNNQYKAIFDMLHEGSGPAALAAIESAGPFDYQDYPLTHPIYSFLLPGLKNANDRKSNNPLDQIYNTANIIGNYASWLLEKSTGNVIIQRQNLNRSIYLESKGLGTFRL